MITHPPIDDVKKRTVEALMSLERDDLFLLLDLLQDSAVVEELCDTIYKNLEKEENA